jgi:hypothetical protein
VLENTPRAGVSSNGGRSGEDADAVNAEHMERYAKIRNIFMDYTMPSVTANKIESKVIDSLQNI